MDTKTRSALGADFDPWASANLADPLPVYELMRGQEPVHWNEYRGMWFLTGYQDVLRVIMDHQRFSAATFHAQRPQDKLAADRTDDDSQITAGFGNTMMLTDPPEHTRLRRLQVGAFSARALETDAD